MQAIELDARRTKGSVSHAVGNHRVSRYSTRFMVRVWRRSPLRASIEGTCNGGRRSFALQAVVTPSHAPHVKLQGLPPFIKRH